MASHITNSCQDQGSFIVNIYIYYLFKYFNLDSLSNYFLETYLSMLLDLYHVKIITLFPSYNIKSHLQKFLTFSFGILLCSQSELNGSFLLWKVKNEIIVRSLSSNPQICIFYCFIRSLVYYIQISAAYTCIINIKSP